jgi:hypothetical protein
LKFQTDRRYKGKTRQQLEHAKEKQPELIKHFDKEIPLMSGLGSIDHTNEGRYSVLDLASGV